MRSAWCSALVALACFVSASTAIGQANPGGAGDDERRESWDAVYIAGVRVGYFHFWVKPIKDRNRTLVNVQGDMELNLKRGRDSVRMETLYGTIETTDGQVLRLDTRTLVSRQELRAFGDVVNGKMELSLEGAGKPQRLSIPWGSDVRGPYGAEMSMARKPLKEGEVRSVRIFIPTLNKIGDVKLSAGRMESIELGSRQVRELLRVEQETTLEGKVLPDMSGTHWVDSEGQILHTSIDVFGGMKTYRTTREAARKTIQGTKFDLTEAQLVRVRRPIPKPTEQRSIKYRLSVTGDDLTTLFPNDRRQTLTVGVAKSMGELTVTTAGPDDGEQGPEQVDAAYSRSSSMIDSDDASVARLAKKATEGVEEPWAKAKAIEHWVFQNIKKKNFETTFASATEVARDLTGDCTEHSVLTAAMCRAVGVPARVAIGLVYSEPQQAFGYHMWNEVYVNRRWTAIDAAFDESEVDATHLKLVETSLDGASPFETFLAVTRVFGRLAIDPLEIR